jgi:PAS domain-containing protein
MGFQQTSGRIGKMKDENKTKSQLIDELREMRNRMADLELNKTGGNTNAETPKHVEGVREEAFKILNSSSMAVFVWRNEEGWPVEFVTDNVENLLGYTPDELLSGKVRYDQIVHPDDLPRVEQEVATFSNEEGRESFVS